MDFTSSSNTLHVDTKCTELFRAENKNNLEKQSITGIHATPNLRLNPSDELHGSRRGGGREQTEKTPGDDTHECP